MNGPSNATVAKAARLIDDGRVSEVGGRVFLVRGFTNDYVVVVYGHGGTHCTCPSRTECSHAVAARELAAGAGATAERRAST